MLFQHLRKVKFKTKADQGTTWKFTHCSRREKRQGNITTTAIESNSLPYISQTDKRWEGQVKSFQLRKGNIKFNIQSTTDLSPASPCAVPGTSIKKDGRCGNLLCWGEQEGCG